MGTDVFVVGGGPAGLAAAIAAAQQGLRVIIADIQQPPIDKACGEGLMPDSHPELARLRVSLEGRERGSFRGIRFVGPRQAFEAEFPRGRGIGIRRTVLHAALIDRAAELGIQMLWGARVAGIAGANVVVEGRLFRTRWVIGADGQNSLVRRWAKLTAKHEFVRRVAVRQHFATADPPDFVEIYWGEDSQAYITPISTKELCLALISRRKLGHLEEEIQNVPALSQRLRDARPTSTPRGAVTLSNRLRRVTCGNVALVGEASGSVDAITGEGLAMAFRQALSLGQALATDDLAKYETAHRRIDALPQFMRKAMLLMDENPILRERALRALQARPGLFARMLSVHVGELPLRDFGAVATADFAWQMLTA